MLNKCCFNWLIILLSMMAIFFITSSAAAQQPIPKVTIGLDKASSPNDVAMTLQIIALLTILSLAPTILITMTSFTRIIVISLVAAFPPGSD